MPPKSGKKGTGSAGPGGPQKWEAGLTAAALNTEDWNTAIILVKPHSTEEKRSVDLLKDIVNSGTRQLFTSVSVSELYKIANDLGNPKQKKDKNTPQFFEINELVKSYLDQNEPVPVQVLAKLLKWRLLNIRTMDQKRRDDEKKAGEGGKGPKSGKGGGGKKERGKSAGKGAGKGEKGKAGATDVPPAPSKESKLKKRGEEDDGSKCLDDEPDDGPHHYILLFDFNDALIVQALDDVGVAVDSVVNVAIDSIESYHARREYYFNNLDDEIAKPKEESDEEKAAKEKLASQLHVFWSEIVVVLKQATAHSKIQDCVKLDYIIHSESIPPDLDADLELKHEYSINLYEGIACLIYDMFDWKRQYKNYLDNMKLYTIPKLNALPVGSESGVVEQMSETPVIPVAAGKGPKTDHVPKATDTSLQLTPTANADMLGVFAVDMRYYKDLISNVPNESVSVGIIVSCLLEQIEATERSLIPPTERPVQPRSDGLDPILAKHLTNVIMKLSLTEKEKIDLEEKLEKRIDLHLTKTERSELFHFYDDLALRTRHLYEKDGFNPFAAEKDILHLTPSAALINFDHPSQHEENERAARFQELLLHCSNGCMSQAEMDQALKQFIFECIQIKKTDAQGIVQSDVEHDFIIPWDDPYPFLSRTQFENVENNEFLSLNNANKEEANPEEEISLSRPSSAGILKASKRPISPAASSKSSVHFAKPQLAQQRPAGGETRPREIHETISTESFIKEEDGGGSSEVDNKDVQHASRPQSNTSRFSPLTESQLRNLDDWCYLEHFEPHVLIQLLEDTRYYYPFIDSYYCRKDNSLLLVLHNPVGQDMFNLSEWFTYLHSDVGFRNYLEHVQSKITKWTDEEEIKYQVALAEQERLSSISPTVDKKVESDTTTKRPGSGKTGKRSRSQSPKGRKGSARSKSPKQKAEAEDSEDEKPEDKPFMRPNSLKEWKLEQDKIKEAEEKKKKEKESSGKAKASAKKGKEKSPPGSRSGSHEGKRSRSGSRGSQDGSSDRKGKKGKTSVLEKTETLSEDALPIQPTEPERIWPFHGYDLGHNIVHGKGSITTLFPPSGGQVRVDRTSYIDGPNKVKMTLLKNRHVFNVHLHESKDLLKNTESAVKLENKKDQEQNQLESAKLGESMASQISDHTCNEDLQTKNLSIDLNAKECSVNNIQKDHVVSEFGSFSAQLSDGISLAFSVYGDSGQNKSVEKVISKIEMKPAAPPTPPAVPEDKPGSRGGKGKKGKGSAKDKAAPTPQQQTPAPISTDRDAKISDDELSIKEDVEIELPKIEVNFQKLHISTPDGLLIQYVKEFSEATQDDDNSLMVVQSYISKSTCDNDCVAFKKVPAMEEKYRIITSQGNVIKMMESDQIIVLGADGSRMEYSGEWLDSKQKLDSTRPSSQASEKTASRPATGKEGRKNKSPSRKSPKDKEATVPHVGDEAHQMKEDEIHDRGIIMWKCTTPNGAVFSTKHDGTKKKIADLKSYTACDPETNEVLLMREDRVLIVERPGNTIIVDHNDGTRMTSFYKEELLTPRDQKEDEAHNEVRLVKFVKIECKGYATLVFNTDDSSCTTIFGSGSSQFTHPTGLYVTSCCDGSALVVNQKGAAAYISKPDNDVIGYLCNCETFENIPETFNKAEIFVLKHSEFNIFSHKDNNSTFTINNMGEIEVSKQISDQTHSEDVFSMNAPRYFIIYKDKSGAELIRHKDIMWYIDKAEQDPSTAVMVDPLPEHPGLKGITIMRPCVSDISKKWLIEFEEANIIPKSLTSRDLTTLPVKDVRSAGPPLGSNAGRGLAIGSLHKAKPKEVTSVPKAVEFRKFIAFQKIRSEIREALKEGLKSYSKTVIDRETKMIESRQIDPRSPEEQTQAEHLQQMLSSHVKSAENPFKSQSFQLENLEGRYLEGVKLEPPPSPKKAQPRRKPEDWENDRLTLEKEAENKRKLKNKEIPSYFKSVLAQSFVEKIKTIEMPDTQALSGSLPYYEVKKRDAKIAQEKTEKSEQLECNIQKQTIVEEQEQNANSTSGQECEGEGIEKEKQDDDDGKNIVVKELNKIKYEPNLRFYRIEEPVRRKPNTVSVAGAIAPQRIGALRGFMVRPTRLDFGILREGFTYCTQLQLKNIGLDSCRFKVKPPSPSTGLTIKHKPGKVAAGMSVELEVTIVAIAANPNEQGESVSPGSQIEIITEVELISIPVAAIVLTSERFAAEFGEDHQTVQTYGPSVRLLSTESSANIIRPTQIKEI